MLVCRVSGDGSACPDRAVRGAERLWNGQYWRKSSEEQRARADDLTVLSKKKMCDHRAMSPLRLLFCVCITLLVTGCGPSSSPAEPATVSPPGPKSAERSDSECAAACATRPPPKSGWCWTAAECSRYCTANDVDSWAQPRQAAFLTCARENPLCYQSLEQCIGNRQESAAAPQSSG